MTEWLADAWESLRVRWLMLDAQQKQVILLAALYLSYTLLDVGGALAKARIATKGAS